MQLRSLLLLALPVLAGCAAVVSPPDDAAWREIQAERLARLHGDRDFATALDRLRLHRPGSAPRTVAQEPRSPQGRPDRPKIDQRLPARLDLGPRRYRGVSTPLRVVAEAGVGTYQVIVPRTSLSDRADTAFLRLGIDGSADSPSGASLHLDGFASDGDLFGQSLIHDGVAPANADARIIGYHAFPHLRLTAMADSEWAMPVRLGLAVGHVAIEHHRADVDRDWLTLGPRLEVEPRMALLGTGHDRLDLFGRLGGEFGYGWFREEYQGSDDNDRMTHWAYDVGLGLRWRQNGWWFDVGYEFGQGRMGGTDTDLLGNRSGVRMEHQKVFVGGALRF